VQRGVWNLGIVSFVLCDNCYSIFSGRCGVRSGIDMTGWLRNQTLVETVQFQGIYCIAEDLDTRIFALIMLVEAEQKEDENAHFGMGFGEHMLKDQQENEQQHIYFAKASHFGTV
jgi:hypothetical protein